MAATDMFASEITAELLQILFQISRKSCFCKSRAESLVATINELLPIIQEIKYSGVEVPAHRQFQLDHISRTLQEGTDLAKKVLGSGRWNVYRNFQLANQMEKFENKVSKFMSGPMQAHVLADVHHLRFEVAEGLDRAAWSARRVERSIEEMKIGVGSGGGWVEEAVRRMEVEEQIWESSLVNFGMEEGKRRVKEMVMERDDLRVVGICGIGGSGKTTLATDICRDEQVKCCFKNRVLFLTVSQSPNVDQLRATIWGFIVGVNGMSGNDLIPKGNPQFDCGTMSRVLIVLDDVWSLMVLEKLIFKVPGCKTLVVSRFKFPSVLDSAFEVEGLRQDEATSLFCHYAFGQKSIPISADPKLVNQIVDECKGLPLALKVIGASLREQPEMYWVCARKRLSKGEPICESHESKVLDRMAISIQFLSKKVKECFFDLGCFPEDKKIPIDVLINMWSEIHDLVEEEAFVILLELSDKNLLTLVKDSRAGDLYTCYYDISVTQHDVLRDLAIYMSTRDDINVRKRLVMPRREAELPKEWERHSDQPFNAQIVSIHTDEMKEMDWFPMDFPKAEVLILNFSANQYFLPPFVDYMRKLRALIVINSSNSNATLFNFSDFANLTNLRSIWLERVSIEKLSDSTPLKKLQKISLVLCKMNSSLDESAIDLPHVFPSLVELTIDHCDDLLTLPSSICRMQSLKSLSITNCHNLHELPTNLGNMKLLQVLRLYACPNLKTLPSSSCKCELVGLKFLDVSQCVNLKSLPEWIGKSPLLEKIDMRECVQIENLPSSAASLESLRKVICDEEVSWLWKDVRNVNLDIQVAERDYNLDWLDEK